MSLEIFEHGELEQGSPEWLKLRSGLVTASEFSSVLAKGAGVTRRKLLLRLVGESITGEPEETFKSPAMIRGNEMEDEARRFYAATTDNETQRVAFLRDLEKGAGCSPDSFVGEFGGIEIKTAKPSVLIEYHHAGKFPSEHVAQCQGFLWISGRKWIDIAIYWPKIPMFIMRAERDEAYIANLAAEVKAFNAEMQHEIDFVNGRW